MTAEDLLDLPDFSTDSLWEIVRAMAAVSIRLKSPSIGRPAPAEVAIDPDDTGVLAIPIRIAFEFESRVRNSLAAARIRTVGELIRKSESDLLGLKNFGRTSLAAVKGALAQHSLHLGTTEDVIRMIRGLALQAEAKRAKEPAVQPATIEEEHQSLDAGVLTLPTHIAFLSDTRARNALTHARIRTIGELVRREEESLLALKNFGRRSLTVVREVLSQWGLSVGMLESEIRSWKRTVVEARDVSAIRNGGRGDNADKGGGTGGYVLEKDIAEQIEKIRAELPIRDQQLLGFHYQAEARRTLEDTGRKFGLTRERVRQLIARSCDRIAVKMQHAGIEQVAHQLYGIGEICCPDEDSISYLKVPVKRALRLSRLINAIADCMNDSEQIFFDPIYNVWHRGAPVDARLDGLRERLPALCSRDEVVKSIVDLLRLKEDRLCVAESAADTFVSLEMIPLAGTGCMTHKQTPKARLMEDVLKKVFPKGAHFTQLATASMRFPASKQLEARNAHATLSLNPAIVLWGRGTFRHKDSFRLDETRFSALVEKIDELFLPDISVVSAIAIFERYRSLVVQMGIPNSYALYGCLEWRYPKRYLYRHYPDIESLKATRRPKTRRVSELEAILEDSDRPLSVEEIITAMGSHRRLKDHHVIQRLPESKCVLLYDAGCYAHESVLGLTHELKGLTQERARAFLRLGPGYATTKQIRLSIELPAIKLPWTLRLLGSILEQDKELTRIYNLVALGHESSWETLLGRIILDSIGSRPGITLDDLNEYLLAREFVSSPFTQKTLPTLTGLIFSDGYIRTRA